MCMISSSDKHAVCLLIKLGWQKEQYHHFKIIEEIWEAVCKRIVEDKSDEFAKIRDNRYMHDGEKLSTI